MKKCIATIMCLSMIFCFFFWRCRETQEDAIGGYSAPEISSDFFFLASEHVFYSCDYSGDGFFYIPLISGSCITQEDIEVEIAGTTLTENQCTLGQEEKVAMPFYVYQTFRGKNWKSAASLQLEYRELESKGLFGNEELNEISNKLIASQEEFLSDYQTLQSAGKLPVLYRYLLSFFLYDVGRLSEKTITEITVRIRDSEQVFPVGRINYKAENYLPPIGPETLVRSRGIAGWHGASADRNGNITEKNGMTVSRCRAAEDVTITAIDLWQDNRTLSDVQVIIINVSSEGNVEYDEDGNEIYDIVADFIYDGRTPIFLSEGQEIAVNFTLHDPLLQNAVCGYTEYRVALHYENSAGDKGITTLWYPTRIETVSGDPFEIYLQYVLGIDMMSYYSDYYNILEPMGGVVILDIIEEE